MRERAADTNARSHFRTIGLIAGREISQRLRSRAFHLVTALVALCAFAIVMVPHWFQSSSHTRVVVEVTDADSPVTSVLRQQLTAAGFDVTVSATPPSTDLLNSGEADAVLGGDGMIAVSSEATPDARAAITAIALQASMTTPVHEVNPAASAPTTERHRNCPRSDDRQPWIGPGASCS